MQRQQKCKKGLHLEFSEKINGKLTFSDVPSSKKVSGVPFRVFFALYDNLKVSQ